LKINYKHMKERLLIIMGLFLVFVNETNAQALYNNGVDIKITRGATVFVDGNVQNEAGNIDVDAISGNSQLLVQADFINNDTAGGDGYFKVLGDWYNNALFLPGTGTVFLEGAAQTLGGSVSTTFHNLTLDGSGVKTQTIDQYCTGTLSLNDIELNTGTYRFSLENTDVNAITLGTGFVSSQDGGFLSRMTNSASTYLFPVGSSAGTPRYRPVEMTPDGTGNTFTVRMANADATSEGFDIDSQGFSICQVNPLFYHQIDRTAGTSAVDLSIYYDDVDDGNWEGIANWSTSPGQWEVIPGSTTSSGSPLYQATATDWNDFTNLPYALYITTPDIDAGSNSPVCEGAGIELTESGGDANSWSWSGPNGFISDDNNPVISPATIDSEGTYYVTITNGGGCTAIDSVFVEIYHSPSVVAGSDSPACEGGVINLTEDGGDAVSWEWSGPGSYSSSVHEPVISSATLSDAGTYSVTITDDLGCTAEGQTDITVNPNPVTPTVNIDCSGGEDQGVIEVTDPTGTDYEYTVDGSYQSSPDIGPLLNGTYTVTVMNTTTGCTTAGSSVSLDCGCLDPTSLTLNSNAGETCDLAPVTVSGNNFGGSATEVNLSHDGSGTLDATNFNTSPFDFTYTPHTDDAGNDVTITVETDNPEGAPCTSSQDNYVLTVHPIPVATAGSNAPVCENTDLELFETGGDADSWEWSGPGYSSSDHEPVISGVSSANAGIYSVTITDGNGCTNTDDVDVTVNETPVADAGGDETICEGDDIEIGGNPTASGGSGSGYAYAWGPSTGLSSTTVANPTASPGSSEIYTVTVTDSEGCTNTDDMNVTVNSAPDTPTASTDCAAGEDNGIIDVTSPEGAEYEYSIDGSFQTETEFGPLDNGSYTVTVMNINTGCTSEGNATDLYCGCDVPPTLTLSSNVGETCGSAPITISNNTFGGSATQVTLSDDGEGSLDQNTITSSDFEFTYMPAAGDIGNTVVITITTDNPDGPPCVPAEETFTLTVHPVPDAIAGSNSPICEGENLSLTESGGDAELWLWSGPNGYYSIENNPDILAATLTEDGTYAVTVTDENGCTNEDNVNVNVYEIPDPTITPPGDLCSDDDPIDLTAASPGGTWSGDGITDASAGTFDPSQASIGYNTITYEAGAGECTASDNLDILVIETPSPTISDPGDFCSDDDPESLSADIAGGIWIGDGITDAATGTFDPSQANIGTNTVTYEVTNSGCTGTDMIDINVYDSADASIDAAGPFCTDDDPVDLTAATSGGTWSGNGITDASNGTFDPSEANIGTNTITYEVGTGTCADIDSIDIEVYEATIATIDDPGDFCSDDDTVVLNAANPGGTWNGDGIDPATGVFDPGSAGPGTHEIIYTIAGTCGDADTLNVTVYPRADATIINPVDSMFISEDPLTLDAVDDNGEWSGNGIDPLSGEFSPQEAGLGDHQIIYTIDQVCGDADSTTIVVSTEEIKDLLITDVFTPNGDDYNDTWRIQGISAYDDVAIYIFTRWGEKVFEFTGTGNAYQEVQNQWDGTLNGKELPMGTYVYILELNNEESHKGTVTLIY
jgi:gliding motility-associated-like protein